MEPREMTQPQQPPAALDHVAIRVGDRDAVARELVERLAMRTLQHTERLTLLGVDPHFGKLTLLDAQDTDTAAQADDERTSSSPGTGRLVSLSLAAGAGERVPPPMSLACGIVFAFIGVEQLDAPAPRHAVVGVTLRSENPPLAAAELEQRHHMGVGAVQRDMATLLVGSQSGQGRVTLVREHVDEVQARCPLDHLGLLVDDAERYRTEAEGLGIQVVNIVDTDNTYAVFVDGPEHMLIEYVEHKPEFAIV